MLKKVQEVDVRKLDPKWKATFIVIEKLSSGAYYLEDLMGKNMNKQWNTYHICKYYA